MCRTRVQRSPWGQVWEGGGGVIRNVPGETRGGSLEGVEVKG